MEAVRRMCSFGSARNQSPDKKDPDGADFGGPPNRAACRLRCPRATRAIKSPRSAGLELVSGLARKIPDALFIAAASNVACQPQASQKHCKSFWFWNGTHLVSETATFDKSAVQA